MKKFIITISREFGCNAREVARKAAFDLYNTILTEMCPTYLPSSYHSHSL